MSETAGKEKPLSESHHGTRHTQEAAEPEEVASASISDQGNGTYILTHKLPKKGKYEISVRSMLDIGNVGEAVVSALPTRAAVSRAPHESPVSSPVSSPSPAACSFLTGRSFEIGSRAGHTCSGTCKHA